MPSRTSPLLLLLAACTASSTTDRIEPTSIRVEVDGELGSPADPLPFSGESMSRTIRVETLDKDGEPWPLEGDLSLRIRTGKLDQAQWITVSEGRFEGPVAFHAAFGPSRIWVSDEGDKDSESGRTPSFATGVTDAMHFAFPTIAEMNEIDDHETNQLAGEFSELRIDDRQVVVTEIGTNGFWVTDLADGPAAYNSLYVYSFSKPTGIWTGARLTTLTGNNQEYLATTQLSFPVYLAEEGSLLDLPDAIEISAEASCDNDLMEAMESSLVKVSGASIPADFVPGGVDYEDYIEFGQWPIDLASGGCRIYADSSTAPDFHPPDLAGQEIGEIHGLLREIWGKWILTARDESDIGGGGPEDERGRDPSKDRTARIGHPLPRPAPGAPAPAPARAARAPFLPIHDPHGH